MLLLHTHTFLGLSVNRQFNTGFTLRLQSSYFSQVCLQDVKLNLLQCMFSHLVKGFQNSTFPIPQAFCQLSPSTCLTLCNPRLQSLTGPTLGCILLIFQRRTTQPAGTQYQFKCSIWQCKRRTKTNSLSILTFLLCSPQTCRF